VHGTPTSESVGRQIGHGGDTSSFGASGVVEKARSRPSCRRGHPVRA
jgi:hypothetical protein